MQSLQLIEYIESLNKDLDDKELSTIYEWIYFLENQHQRLEKFIFDAANLTIPIGNNPFDNNQVAAEKVKIQGNLNNIVAEIKNKELPGKIFIGLHNIKENYTSFIRKINQDHSAKYLVFISHVFSELGTTYDNFVINPNYITAFLLTNAAKTFNKNLKNSVEIINIISCSLQETYDDENLSFLSLKLDSDYTFQQFIEKLQAIQSIYSEMCYLFEISEYDFPLRIAKIESGSLWLKIFGESKIINLFADSIKDAKEYGYRNMTREGKIRSVPEDIKAVEALLGLRDKMKEGGINTKDVDEKISKSTSIIADNLNILLSGEKKVTLNGELIEENDNQQKLLKGSKNYLIEASKDVDENQ